MVAYTDMALTAAVALAFCELSRVFVVELDMEEALMVFGRGPLLLPGDTRLLLLTGITRLLPGDTCCALDMRRERKTVS